MTTTQKERKPRKPTYPRKFGSGPKFGPPFGPRCPTLYRRMMPNGKTGYMLTNYASGQRKLVSYADEEMAIAAAETLVRQMSNRQVLAAQLSNAEAQQFVGARDMLAPYGVSVLSAAEVLAECFKDKLVAGLTSVRSACEAFARQHKAATPRRVEDLVVELISLKEQRGASKRYLEDLRHRLGRLGEAFQKDVCNVITSEVQEWLDQQKLSAQSYTNHRRVAHLFFEYAVARGFATENPVAGTEARKVRGSDVMIYKPEEIARLLAAAPIDFVPCLALGAFGGLRSAEIERLSWEDLDLKGGHITITAGKAKTASRRIVPLLPNLAKWLAPFAGCEGAVWKHSHEDFYDAQQATAAATEIAADPEKGIRALKAITWRANGLRHSYASYRFAQTGDAGRVAGELCNSAVVVHRHYRELAKPQAAEQWFSVAPEAAQNITPLPRLHAQG